MFGALDADTAEKLVIALVVVLIVITVLVARSTFVLWTKIVIVVVLAGLGVALLQNRTELARCSQTCACEIYGHDVEVPHLPFACNY